MNRFYKFVKAHTWPWVRFHRYEFQEMIGETVNEDAEPISVKKYWAKQYIFDAYNSYYYGELKPLHNANFEVWELDIKAKVYAFIYILLRRSGFSKVIHRLSTLKFSKKTIK